MYIAGMYHIFQNTSCTSPSTFGCFRLVYVQDVYALIHAVKKFTLPQLLFSC